MASANTLCKNLLNVKNVVVESNDFYQDENGIAHLCIQARPNAWHKNDCPICGRRCAGYDQPSKTPRRWRALDFGGVLADIEAYTHRIVCPEHGVLTAAVPWAYPGSRFTKEFDLMVTWLAEYLPKSVVAELMRIDWQTVGTCISRSLHDLEPERKKRLDGLVRIGIDETSYKKGHKYITVVVNHDTNTVVWIGKGHGKSVLEKFYRSLNEEQLASIRVVTGDGARWITDCVNGFTPDCERCVDTFHVVEWAMEALDEVRKDRWRVAHEKAKQLQKGKPTRKGRPSKDDSKAKAARKAKNEADAIKGASYTLGKAPEHLTESQRLRLEKIQSRDPQLYRAYRMKEALRILLKSHDTEQAKEDLKRWLWWASHSRIPAFKKLYQKIKRHKEHILNTIRLGMTNARVEAINRKIKLMVNKSCGFRNFQNMVDMIYLVCSDLKVPLPNRKLTSMMTA